MVFEARHKASLWKRLIEAVKDLVGEANFDCGLGGASIQAMDPAHVALVHLLLKKDGFDMYSCHRAQMLGINLQSFSRVLKAIDNNDTLTLRHEDDSDIITVAVEADGGNKSCEFQLKLMEIEADAMGIPEDMDYTARVQMSSSDFSKICRDMGIFGDTVTVDVKRDTVRFSGSGDIGEGFQEFKGVAGRGSSEAAASTKKVKPEVKSEPIDEDQISGAADKIQDVKDEDAKDKKHKIKNESSTVKGDDVVITAQENVQLSFALRYLNTFAKGSALSERVTLNLAKESPCMIEYTIDGIGYLRWYLAPKVDEGEAQ